jgi:uncharacterized membrane protein YecN with MAPEG domain
MRTTSTLKKPGLIGNDFFPATAKMFVLFTLGLTFLFRAFGYFLSQDIESVTRSHDWIYHAFWLPLHLFLARYASVVFSRNVDACNAFSCSAVREALSRLVRNITGFKGWCVSMLLISPFLFLDSVAAIEYIQAHVQSQGHAAKLIPIIWLIEWMATAQIWLYVLGSILVNSRVVTEQNIKGRHEDILITGQFRAPLLCGLENALITLIYGISTIGYVWYADGQVSDYLVLGISTLLVLVCFFAALFQMKIALRKSLEMAFVRYEELLKRQARLATAHTEPVAQANVPYAEFKEAVGLIFERKTGRDSVLEDRLRRIKLATMLHLPEMANTLNRETYSQSLLLIECETRYAAFGVGEIKTLSIRAVMPLFIIVGKSAGGLLGTH